MLSRRAKRLIIVIGFIQVMLIILLMALPDVVLAIPGRFRVALAERSPFLSDITESLIEQVVRENDFLPAPESTASGDFISIPSVVVTRSVTPTITPLPTLSAQPTAEVDEQAGAERTPKPSPTYTPSPTATPTFAPLPRQVHIEGLERVQQNFNNCGPANLTQVLKWYGDETTQNVAASYLKPNAEDRNVSPWQLSDYVNEFTELRSTVHSGGTLEMIKRFLASGFPVVVEKGYEPDTTGAQGWFGHYLTVFGYDDDRREFYGLDTYVQPDPAGRIETYETMEEYWAHFNYTFYVVYKPEREEEVQRILGPEMLEPVKMWENAAIRAQLDIDNDPENAFAWFNLGTSLTRMGELLGNAEFYQNGAAAFDQARSIGLPPRKLWYEHRPYIAYMKVGRYDDMIDLADAVLSTQGGRNVEETYLYKGHALLYLGDVLGAAEAYRSALELNENFYPAEIALQSIS